MDDVRWRLNKTLRYINTNNNLMGICMQAQFAYFTLFERDPEMSLAVSQLLNRLMGKWPNRSLYDTHPVPHPTLNPVTAFGRCPRWEGEYGESRQQLLDWLIEQTEEPNEGMDNN